MKKFLLFTLSICFLWTAIAQGTLAQEFIFGGEDEDGEGPKVVNPYADKYKPNLKSTPYSGTTIAPNFIFHTGFIRKPDADADDLNLVIVSPSAVVGCLDKFPPSVETVNAAPALQIKIGSGMIGVKHNEVHYFHYECKPETGMTSIQLTLSKQQLMDDKINKLVFISEDIGPFNDVFLDMNENFTKITSTTKDLSSFGLPVLSQSSEFTYWNYPEGTMVLFSTTTDLNDPAKMSDTRKLARLKSLTPLDEIHPNFEPHPNNTDKLYVVDTMGLYKNQLSKPKDTFTLGTINQNETYYGPEGPYEKAIPKPVFAKLPGMLE